MNRWMNLNKMHRNDRLDTRLHVWKMVLVCVADSGGGANNWQTDMYVEYNGAKNEMLSFSLVEYKNWSC